MPPPSEMRKTPFLRVDAAKSSPGRAAGPGGTTDESARASASWSLSLESSRSYSVHQAQESAAATGWRASQRRSAPSA